MPALARRPALLVVDVVNDFAHEDGDALLESFRARQAGMVALLGAGRDATAPVVYANDTWGAWDGDRSRLIRQAVEDGRGGDVVRRIAPRPDEPMVIKPRYSAFDHTPLELVLEQLGVRRLLLAGAATEHCVTHTALAAQQLGYDVAVVPEACACVSEELESLALAYLSRVAGIALRGVRDAFG